jgi:hypothetical protein
LLCSGCGGCGQRGRPAVVDFSALGLTQQISERPVQPFGAHNDLPHPIQQFGPGVRAFLFHGVDLVRRNVGRSALIDYLARVADAEMVGPGQAVSV